MGKAAAGVQPSCQAHIAEHVHKRPHPGISANTKGRGLKSRSEPYAWVPKHNRRAPSSKPEGPNRYGLMGPAAAAAKQRACRLGTLTPLSSIHSMYVGQDHFHSSSVDDLPPRASTLPRFAIDYTTVQQRSTICGLSLIICLTNTGATTPLCSNVHHPWNDGRATNITQGGSGGAAAHSSAAVRPIAPHICLDRTQIASKASTTAVLKASRAESSRSEMTSCATFLQPSSRLLAQPRHRLATQPFTAAAAPR